MVSTLIVLEYVCCCESFSLHACTRTSTCLYFGRPPLFSFAAQFDRHIYHATTRLMGLYHAQRQNRTAFGEVDGDGFLPPLDARNHPIESE